MRRDRARGLTLVEITITLAIIAMAAAVIIPAVSGTSRAELRSKAGKVAGTVKATYDSAALEGRPYRIAFDFEQKVIRVEQGDESVPNRGVGGLAALLSGAGAGAGAGKGEGKGKKGEPLSLADLPPPPPEILALFGMAAPGKAGNESDSEGMAKFQNAGHDLELGEDVKLLDVWIEGHTKPAIEGTPYLRFFPHGYTENALVHLTDEGGDVLTVKIEALTGRTEILDHYVEPK